MSSTKQKAHEATPSNQAQATRTREVDSASRRPAGTARGPVLGSPHDSPSDVGTILALQRAVGNREVRRILQAKHAAGQAPVDLGAPPARHAGAKNSTGLPDRLKAGVETLSGLSLSDVRVHYNSGRPAEVRALAYTQGTQIYVGPGQEKHLPHEAWHVVQQKQGRVRPTFQAKGAPINDDEAMEDEAEAMGAMSASMPEWEEGQSNSDEDAAPAPVSNGVIQRAIGLEIEIPVPVDHLGEATVNTMRRQAQRLHDMEQKDAKDEKGEKGDPATWEEFRGKYCTKANKTPSAANIYEDKSAFRVAIDHEDRVLSHRRAPREAGYDAILEIVMTPPAEDKAQFLTQMAEVKAFVAKIDNDTAGLTKRKQDSLGDYSIGPIDYKHEAPRREPQHGFQGSVQVNIGIPLADYGKVLQWYVKSEHADPKKAAKPVDQRVADLLRLEAKDSKAADAAFDEMKTELSPDELGRIWMKLRQFRAAITVGAGAGKKAAEENKGRKDEKEVKAALDTALASNTGEVPAYQTVIDDIHVAGDVAAVVLKSILDNLNANEKKNVGDAPGLKGFLTHVALYLQRGNRGAGTTIKNRVPAMLKTANATFTGTLSADEKRIYDSNKATILRRMLKRLDRADIPRRKFLQTTTGWSEGAREQRVFPKGKETREEQLKVGELADRDRKLVAFLKDPGTVVNKSGIGVFEFRLLPGLYDGVAAWTQLGLDFLAQVEEKKAADAKAAAPLQQALNPVAPPPSNDNKAT